MRFSTPMIFERDVSDGRTSRAHIEIYFRFLRLKDCVVSGRMRREMAVIRCVLDSCQAANQK